MKFRKQKFGGMRPVCTGSPALSVSGGFNLDIVKVKYPIGAVIPEASLAQYDEILRKVVVLKASRVVAINATDAKKVSLECDEFLTPIFMVNDHVAKDETGNFEDTASIAEIKHDRNGYVITLSKEITGLKVGDALFEVIAGSVEGEGKAPVVFPVDAPQGVTNAAEQQGTVVGRDETSVDVTTDSKGAYFYERRIPPIPEKFIAGHCLKTNPNIQFTKSY